MSRLEIFFFIILERKPFKTNNAKNNFKRDKISITTDHKIIKQKDL